MISSMSVSNVSKQYTLHLAQEPGWHNTSGIPWFQASWDENNQAITKTLVT